MRTIVNLPESYVKALEELCHQEHLSRSEAIRRAINRYCQEKMVSGSDKAFAIWKGRQLDSLKYEDRLRAEWESDEGGD